MNFAGLRPHQIPHVQQIVAALRTNRAALDASDTGTGKTFSALWIARESGQVPFVVGPKAARPSWLRAAMHIGVDIEYANYEKLRVRKKKGDVFLTDTEWLEEQKWGSGSFLKWKSDYGLMIFDEVHRCGGKTSLNSKMLIAAKRQAGHVLCLSATAADDPRQMKALGYVLGLHQLNGKRFNYMSWLLRHGVKPGWAGGFDFTDDPAEQAAVFTQINREIFPHRGARMRKAEIPGFPKTLIGVKALDPVGKAEKLSSKLHELYHFRVNQGIGSEGMVETIRIRQQLEILKVPDLVSLTLDYGQTSKVVLFVNFTDTLQLLREELQNAGLSVGVIDGSQTGDGTERQDVLDQFQANQLDAMVCNSEAGGESLSAHDPTGKVERTALISPPTSGRKLVQIFGRVNRDGGAFSQQFLVGFAGTYEEEMLDRVNRKVDNIELLNDADLAI